MKLRLQLFWAGVQDVACKVGLVPLPHYFLKLSLNRLNQTTVLVGDHKVHSPKPSSFEPRQEVIPTAVSLAVANPKPQHLASHSLTKGCNLLHSSDTADLENSVPHSSSVILFPINQSTREAGGPDQSRSLFTEV